MKSRHYVWRRVVTVLGLLFGLTDHVIHAQQPEINLLTILAAERNSSHAAVAVLTWTSGEPPFQVQCRTGLVDEWQDIGGVTYVFSQTNLLTQPTAFYRVISVAEAMAASSDKTAPSTPTVLTATAINSNAINLTWNAVADNGLGATGLKGYNLYRNEVFLKQIPVPATSTSDDGLTPSTTYSYSVSAVDNAYNESSLSTPATATTPADGRCTYRISPTESSVAASGDYGSVAVAAAAGCAWTATTDASWVTITVGGSGMGNGTVSYSVATNTTSSVRSGTLTIAGETFAIVQALDTTLPSIALISPANGTTVSATVTVNANATDNVGVTKVEIYRDGTTLLAADTASPYSVSDDTTVLVNGSHNYHAKAFDAAGNWTISSTNTVTVSNTSTDPGTWVMRIGNTGADYASAVALDSNGNIFIAGSFSGTVDFGGGRVLTSVGGYDVFLAKYNAAGGVQWANRFGGTGSETVKSMALDPFGGNIYISGGLIVGSLAKFSPQGDLLWTAGPAGARFTSIDTDSRGNVVVTGDFTAPYTSQMDFGGGKMLYSQYGSGDAFLAMYSTNSQCLWAKGFFNYGDNEFGTRVAVDKGMNLNDIVVTGYAMSDIDLGGGDLTNNAYGAFGYLARFDPSGNHRWSRRCGTKFSTDSTAPYTRIRSMAIDGNGDIILSGEFKIHTNLGGEAADGRDAIINGNSSQNDMFVAKYAGRTGAYQWSQPVLSNGGGQPNSVSVDANNNAVVTGLFYGTCNFGGQSLTAAGPNPSTYADGFVAKYSSGGAPVWAQQFGGANGDGGSCAAVDGTNHPVVAGYFQGSATFAGQSVSSAGDYDIILGRLNP